ncbi:Leader peptidase (Prepilin peptidase) / N-methyltransferase [Enterobacter hormaechei]|nr:Leader peptidase (Prepilin peptidase) / N-methyltransferase [Enterobacter hormaechei]
MFAPIFARGFFPINFFARCYGPACFTSSASILIFLPSAVVGAMAGYAGFAVIYWGYRLICRREGMGYGDIKYLAALGAWHGWCVLPVLALVAALMALLYLVAFSLFTPDKQALKNPLPFGPFLAAAGLCVGWESLINFPL